MDDEHDRQDQAAALLSASGVDATKVSVLLRTWAEMVDARMHAIRDGHLPWQGHRSIRRVTLQEALSQSGVSLDPDLVDELSG